MRSSSIKPLSEPANNPHRRWFQFSLRTLLGTLLVCSCVLGLVARERIECAKGQADIETIRRLGGSVNPESKVLFIGIDARSKRPIRSSWLQLVLGNDSFRSVSVVDFYDCPITDADLVCLKRLTGLESLVLHNTKITGVGLQHLKGATNLGFVCLKQAEIADTVMQYLKELSSIEYLNLEGTPISSISLEYLKELPQLRYLCVDGTTVAKVGWSELEKGLPNCEIR